MNIDTGKVYDVAIVGAGPGGSMTARECAKAGLSVIVFEKRPEIGSPKRCGEGIGLNGLESIGYKGNEKFIMQPIEGAYMYAPNQEFLELPGGRGGFVIERKLFDKQMAYDAAKEGAKIFTNAEVYDLLFEKGRISGLKVRYEGEDLEIRSRMVVAADGVESKISRIAGLKTHNTPSSIDSGYQYEMANIEIGNPKMIYFYVGNDIAPRGYVWIFPKGDHIANVGIGIAGHHKMTAKYYLDKWIESMPGIKKGAIIEENSGGIPIGNFLKDMTADNFIAVGDAAHQVNPIHGGGLVEATAAGKIAAEVMAKAISSGDTSREALAPYNEQWWAQQGENLVKVEKAMKVFEKMSDDELNMVISAIDGDSVVEIARGKLTGLIKILMKKPSLVKLARHLA